MGRRASGKRKRGKAVRGARRSQAGEPEAINKIVKGFDGAHAKRRERREEERQARLDAKTARREADDGAQTAALDHAPHSFVFHRGRVGRYAQTLVRDIRRLMEPYTASKLKVQKGNNLKDFVVNAAPLHVSHLVVVTRSELSLNVRLVRLPTGPTLTFRVRAYALARHVRHAQRRPVCYDQQLRHQPLLVLNNFTGHQRQLQLMKSMFQNMFPSIKIDSLDLNNVRRCVLVSYDETEDTVELRHYAIKTVPAELSRPVKKLVTHRASTKVPNLARYGDISEYFLDPGQLSESEGEQDDAPLVPLPQDLTSRGCKKDGAGKVNVRLSEIGPRLTMQLLKIEEGISTGEVLYHSHIMKSQEELAEQRRQLPKRKKTELRREKEEQHRVIARLKELEERREHLAAAESRERESVAARTGNDLGADADAAKPGTDGAPHNRVAKRKLFRKKQAGRPAKRRKTQA